MDTVPPWQLAGAVHDVLEAKDALARDYRDHHGVALRDLYRLLKRKRAGEYIDVSLDVDELEGPDDYDTWKAERVIDAAGVAGVVIPPVPPVPPQSPPSPPPITVEPPNETPVPTPTPPPERELRRSSRPSSRTASRHGTPAAPRSTETRTTVALDDVLPRRPASFGAFGSEIEVPPWEPLDNYCPAEDAGPSEAHSVLMPLENDYSARISKLPHVPHTRRRGSKNEGRPDSYKLSVMFGLNPVSGGLTRSPKVVLTADWRVAQAEMRHIRAMERIEAKKATGRWSLRQPKKHRGPPVPKGHWDFLLDEMEWMQVDFSEERRWKRVVAREFAYQAVEWHLSSPGEKAELMVGGRGWGACKDIAVPGRTEADKIAEDDVEELLVGADPEESELAEAEAEASAHERGDTTGTEVLNEILERPEDKPPEGVKMEVDEDAVGEADAEGEDADGEDADGEDADGEADADGEEDDADDGAEGQAVGLEEIADAEKEAEAKPDGKKEDSPEATVLPNGLLLSKRFKDVEELARVRQPLLYMSAEAPTADLTTLPLTSKEKQAATDNVTDSAFLSPSNDPPPSLLELFPDLAVYGGPTPPDGIKVHRRLDEGQTSGNRLAHTSRILDIRPVFVSHIQPAKSQFDIDDVWDIRDGPWYEDPKGSTDIAPEVVACNSMFFSGRNMRPFHHHNPQAKPEGNRPDPTWLPEEDKILQKLVSQYAFNWQLVADAFNTERVTIPSDRRTAYDCYEHWNQTWGPGKNKSNAETPAANTPTPVPTKAAGTPGTPAANGAPGQPMEPPPPPGLSKREARAAKAARYEGTTKKAVRHQALHDAMRRLSRRRDNKAKESVKDQEQREINVHESHGMVPYPNGQPPTPFELVEAKFQRDLRMQEAQQQRRLLQEQQRQQHAAQMRAQQQQLMAGANAQQARPPAVRPPVPANGNMAQAQLLNAVAAASAVNGRQQQMANGQPAGQASPVPNGARPTPVQMTQAQIQILQQQRAAAQAQAQAQAQAMAQAQAAQQVRQQAAHMGTPQSQPGALASPYASAGEVPNGDTQTSPTAAALQAQQMGRVPSMPMQFPARPQLSPAQQQHLQNIINTLTASGAQVTPDTIRALQIQMLRQAQQQAAAQVQAQQQAVAQAQAQAAAQAQAQLGLGVPGTPGMQTPGLATPQMGMQNLQTPFVRSPSVHSQGVRSSPKPPSQA
ncbi:hypothetical protein CcaverHIS002_0212440 [Cutaneotrichosporon cavernicola]|nr:hypothetical protein CcaverHIS002_0212440 [Cutaneotrichosporon cavernicola]